MKYAGIDIGSRTIELVVVDEKDNLLLSLQLDTGFDPLTEAKKKINEADYDAIMATGY